MQPQRGVKIFNSILFGDDAATVPTTPLKRGRPGRSEELIRRRNEFLLHRFYYKIRLVQSTQPRSYASVLKDLEPEVFLSRVMIQKIITRESDEILRIKKDKPSIQQLRARWPHIVW
jgi:hypothetical protein